MRKVSLKENEVIQAKVKFGKRVLFFNSFIIVFILFINNSLDFSRLFYTLLSILLIVFALVPMILKMILDFLRVFSHRVYLSNMHVYIFKGYLFKRIVIIPLEQLQGVYTKQGLFDKRMGLVNIKVQSEDEKDIIIKGVKNSDEFVQYLSRYIIENAQKSQSE